VHSAETVARSMEIVGRRFWSCRLPYPWHASRQGPPSTSDQSFGTDETTLDINLLPRACDRAGAAYDC
jgi:hypothetical protein